VGGVADKLRLITFAKNHDRSKSGFLKKSAETALQAVKALPGLFKKGPKRPFGPLKP
jgi:hypothetical protein